MANTCKYYKQRRYVSYDNGNTWQPLNEYRKGALYQADSEDCGYEVIYKWQVIEGYTCIGCTKYQKTQKFVSYDGGTTWSAVSPAEYGIGDVIEQGSEDCGCSTQYRWYTLPTTEYICIGYTKYYKQIYQVSFDGGNTWQNVVPEQTRTSGIIEEESVDCGYGQPIYRWVDGWLCDDCVSYKVMSVTSAGTAINVSCGSSTIVSTSDITNRTTISSSTIGSCATEIGAGAYSGCTNLESIRIPNTITTIGNSAFSGCTRLLDASIPDSVRTVGNNAFRGCTQLSFINLPNYLTTLGTYAFRDSLNFSSINIPVTLTYVPEGCFLNCDGLSDVELPNTVTVIGNDAFRECSGLYTVRIHALTPPTLGSNVFLNVNTNFKILVPPSAVDTYKQASGWSTYASKIYPITT